MIRNNFKYLLFAASLIAISACGCTKKSKEEHDAPAIRYSQDLLMHSDILGRDIKYSIYLPESYTKDKSRRYSVVYMLHGFGDDNNSWNGKYLHANNRIDALVSKGQISEMIYVYPLGLTTYYCNYFTGKYNYMDMLIDELIPYIDKTYRTIPDKQHRSITGYSMGGFGAMVLPEKHPDLFCCSAPLSMSFRTDAQYGTEPQSGWEEQWGKIFGGIGEVGVGRITDYYKQHCPFYQFVPENSKTLSDVNWFFTCGDDEEQLLIANDTLHVQLRSIDFPHEFRVENGAHTSAYWMDALSEVLPWFDHHMNGGSAWPECAYASYSVPSPTFNEDGTLPSIAYPSEPSGTAVYFFHNGMDGAALRDVMSVFSSENTKVKYIFLPCDLTKKDVAGWKEHYSAYAHEAEYAVALEGAGATVWSEIASFSTVVFIDTVFNAEPVAEEGRTYLFACTDESDCYADMGALYRSCKRNSAKFEYRVLNASGDRNADRLRCANKLKSTIIY